MNIQPAALVPLINAALLPMFPDNLCLLIRQRLQEFLSGKCLLQMLRVPQELIGHIIGKRGERISRINWLTGCSVQIGLPNQLEITRPVFLLGDLSSIEAAKALLFQIINSVMLSYAPPDIITKVITIPGCHAGLIVGKNGQTIRSLQLNTNTKMTMIQRPGENKYFEKQMVVVGKREDVWQAEILVRNIIGKADKKILNKVIPPSSEKRQNQIISQRDHLNTTVENDISTNSESMDHANVVFEVASEKSKHADEDAKLELEKYVKQLKDGQTCQVKIEMPGMLEDVIKQLEEAHQKKIEEVKEFYEEKIIRTLAHQQLKMLQELELAKKKHVVNAFTGMADLLSFLTQAYQRSILQSFHSDSENVSKLKDESNLHLETIQNFKDLSESKKGLIVIGIAMVGAVVGSTSCKFIFWAWPKLMAFVSAVELNNSAIVVEWVKSFVKTPGYEKFIESWEAGQSITNENILALGPEILRFGFTNLAPTLFRQAENGFASN